MYLIEFVSDCGLEGGAKKVSSKWPKVYLIEFVPDCGFEGRSDPGPCQEVGASVYLIRSVPDCGLKDGARKV